MRTIIAGSRDITDYDLVLKAIQYSGFNITSVVCGGAKGVDSLGERYAFENNLKVNYFIPNWDLHGRSAGPRRNAIMAENADALIAIWDGESRGTANMIENARKRNLKTYIYVQK